MQALAEVEFKTRPQKTGFLEALKKGGEIIVFELDCGFRNTRDGLNALHGQNAKSVYVHFMDLVGNVMGNGVGAIIFSSFRYFLGKIGWRKN